MLLIDSFFMLVYVFWSYLSLSLLNHVPVEKELLEIPDDEIRFLPIRDLLRLVDYKEWLEVIKHSLATTTTIHLSCSDDPKL